MYCISLCVVTKRNQDWPTLHCTTLRYTSAGYYAWGGKLHAAFPIGNKNGTPHIPIGFVIASVSHCNT